MAAIMRGLPPRYSPFSDVECDRIRRVAIAWMAMARDRDTRRDDAAA